MAPRLFIALLLALAPALAGCGGDDEDTTTTGPGATTNRKSPEDLSPRAQRPLEQARQRAQQGQGGQRQSGSGERSATVPFREPTGSAPTTSASLPNEGTRRVAPGVPTAKGGDNSIQEFGVEAPSAERVQASRVLQAYLDARLAGNYALACSYLSGPMKAQLGQFGAGARGQAPPDCTQAMRAFTEGVPKAALRNAAEIRVLSMRVEDEQAFLLYKDGEDLPSAVPMNEEGGAWKVAAIAGSALFLGV
jgi:hypothetical protein